MLAAWASQTVFDRAELATKRHASRRRFLGTENRMTAHNQLREYKPEANSHPFLPNLVQYV
jgi:hypothetical protein